MIETFSLSGNAWLDTLIAASAAMAAALVAHAVLSAVVARIARPHRVVGIFVEHSRSAGRWVLALVALQFVWQAAPPDLPHIGTVEHATSLALIAAVTGMVVRLVRAFNETVEALNPLDAADNLRARSVRTQMRVLGRVFGTFVVVIGVASALITFPGIRQLGATLLASAGLVGIVAGFAARPVLGNLIAGLQIALTQPIRIDDVLIVEGEWGRVEEITGAFVVIRIWDQRRLVVPLQYFIEKPFQNWTRTNAEILGTVFLWVDFRQPVEPLRRELERICRESPEWDGRVVGIVVTDVSDRAMQLRALVSSVDAGRNWDLRCKVREGLVAFMQREFPDNLPRVRLEERAEEPAAEKAPVRPGSRRAESA